MKFRVGLVIVNGTYPTGNHEMMRSMGRGYFGYRQELSLGN